MLTLADFTKHFGCFILMKHALFFFPYIKGIFSDTQKYRNIFSGYNMALTKHRIFCYTADDLCDVMAENCSLCIDCFYQLHV